MAIINAARQFQELLKEKPVLTGTVTSLNGDGTSTVTMTSGGGVIRVKGETLAVNELALIQGGVIIGKAQQLTSFNLDV